jgi:exodeoxyribonuclease V alpha subunit
MPAYAITVHKAQGAQVDNVLLYIGGKASTNRNMLYTAATKAKKKLVIAANEEMLQKSVKIKARPGYTKFAFRVKNRMQNQAYKKKEVDLSRRHR